MSYEERNFSANVLIGCLVFCLVFTLIVCVTAYNIAAYKIQEIVKEPANAAK